jgi:hypothetical protein
MDLTLRDIERAAWHKGVLSWKMDSLQRKISQTVASLPKAKKICILSSRQIGKSYWSVGHTLEFLIKNPNTIGRIVAPTLSNCNDIVGDNLTKITEDAPKEFITRKRSDMRWELSNGSSLRLGALERSNVDQMNRGGNASLIIYEECGFVKSDDFLYGVNSVLGPQLLRSNGKELFVSSPPENPDHALITQIKPECESLGTFFKFTVLDSPSIKPAHVLEAAIRSGCALSDGFINLIKEGKITSENVYEEAYRTNSQLSEAFQREFLAEVIRPTSRMVIPDFSETSRHVAEFFEPSSCNWSITIDWGGVRDKTCAILHTYEYMSNLDLIVDERVFDANTSTSSIVAEIRNSWMSSKNITAIWADVHGQTQVDLTSLGFPVMLPQKSDWLGSVQALAVKFTLNQITVHPRCKFLIRSLKSGMFNKTRTDFERSEELGHCDALACLMYAVRSQDRTNPYSSNLMYNKNTMKFEDRKSEIDSLVPKVFGDGVVKRFGNK